MYWPDRRPEVSLPVCGEAQGARSTSRTFASERPPLRSLSTADVQCGKHLLHTATTSSATTVGAGILTPLESARLYVSSATRFGNVPWLRDYINAKARER